MGNVPWSFYFNTNMCPCKDCKDRHATCHGSCEKYKEWQENRPKVQHVLVDLDGRNRKVR